MSRRRIVRQEAETDLAEAAFWYDDQRAGLGMELTLKVRSAIARALADPWLHLLIRRQPEVRRVLARRFPYRIFFIVRESAIAVFAVLHAARHDRHWRSRL